MAFPEASCFFPPQGARSPAPFQPPSGGVAAPRLCTHPVNAAELLPI